MKLTTKQLRRLIREEYRKTLNEKNPKAPAFSRAVDYEAWEPAKDDNMAEIEVPLRGLALETYEKAHHWFVRFWIGGFAVSNKHPNADADWGQDCLNRFVADIYEASGRGKKFSKKWFAVDREFQREQLSQPIRDWVEQEGPSAGRGGEKAEQGITMAAAFLGPNLDGKGGLVHVLEVLVGKQRDNDREMEILDEPLR